MSVILISVLFILGIALFIFVYLQEEKEDEDWMCYCRKSSRYEASGGCCQGEEGNVRCGHCLYYKQWKRRNYHE